MGVPPESQTNKYPLVEFLWDDLGNVDLPRPGDLPVRLQHADILILYTGRRGEVHHFRGEVHHFT